MCLARVSRPIKRGRIFQNLKPKKPQLTRHIKCSISSMPLSLSTHITQLMLKCICFQAIPVLSWSAQVFRHLLGVICQAEWFWIWWRETPSEDGNGGLPHFSCSSASSPAFMPCDMLFQLSLAPFIGPLVRRPRADWEVKSLSAELHNMAVWLQGQDKRRAAKVKADKWPLMNPCQGTYLSESPFQSQIGVGIQRPTQKSFFLGMDIMTYERDKDKQTDLSVDHEDGQVRNLYHPSPPMVDEWKTHPTCDDYRRKCLDIRFRCLGWKPPGLQTTVMWFSPCMTATTGLLIWGRIFRPRLSKASKWRTHYRLQTWDSWNCYSWNQNATWIYCFTTFRRTRELSLLLEPWQLGCLPVPWPSCSQVLHTPCCRSWCLRVTPNLWLSMKRYLSAHSPMRRCFSAYLCNILVLSATAVKWRCPNWTTAWHHCLSN